MTRRDATLWRRNHIIYIYISLRGPNEDGEHGREKTESPELISVRVTRSFERISAIRSLRSNAAIFLFSSSNQPHRYGNHRVCSCCRVPRSLIACGNINLHGPWAGFASMRAGNDALPDGF